MHAVLEESSRAQPGPCKDLRENFATIKPLTIVAQFSILNVCEGLGYVMWSFGIIEVSIAIEVD